MTVAAHSVRNTWLPSGDGFIGAAWFLPRDPAAACATAVLVVPGIAHEERTMAGGLVALAESLARDGIATLAIDLHGCAQSSGQLDTPNIGERWRQNIHAALRHVREAGYAQTIVIGVRLGALLAIEALQDEAVLGMVAWSPVVSGRRHVRELKMLQGAGVGPSRSGHGALAIGGFEIPSPVLSHIDRIDLAGAEQVGTRHLLVLDADPGAHDAWTRRLTGLGVEVETQTSIQAHTWLFSAADTPTIPQHDIGVVARWCRNLSHARPAARPAVAAPHGNVSVSFMHRGRTLRETFVQMGATGLTGVLTEPVGPRLRSAVRLLVSTVGPGRTFTDFARDEASAGRVCLRFDFSGFGTSPRGAGPQGGALYTDAGAADVAVAVAHLREAGHEHVFLLGFCAGAWSMLQAGALPGVAAAAAINVALYKQPEPDRNEPLRKARERMAAISPALANAGWLKRVSRRIERASKARREPVEWLESLCRAEVPVLMAYAELDPGLQYLERQIAQGLHEGLRRHMSLEVYEGLGHLAEGSVARAHVYRDVAAFFAGADRVLQAEASRARLRSADDTLPSVARLQKPISSDSAF